MDQVSFPSKIHTLTNFLNQLPDDVCVLQVIINTINMPYEPNDFRGKIHLLNGIEAVSTMIGIPVEIKEHRDYRELFIKYDELDLKIFQLKPRSAQTETTLQL